MSSITPPGASNRVRRCLEGLERLSELLQTSNETKKIFSYDDMVGQLGRLRIWAGNIGGLQEAQYPTSLEYRLRDAPKLLRRVNELLEDIEDSLQDSKFF
jgi:hypothetical protein